MLRSPVSHVLFLLFLLAFSTACQSQPNTQPADELRRLDAEWSKVAGSKDVEKTISYYSDDAVLMLPNLPTLTGKEAIRTLWKEMFASQTFSGGWKTTKVEVARSGDLAYVMGDYEFTETESGRPMTDKGKYLQVWKKQPDGSWKCSAHMFSSEVPLAPAAENRP